MIEISIPTWLAIVLAASCALMIVHICVGDFLSSAMAKMATKEKEENGGALMKYIRTEDGRIIKVDISKEEYERDYKDSNVSYEEWFGCLCLGLDIIKQADTIEELCDEFVLHYGDTIQTNIPIPWATYERRGDNWQKHKEKLLSELKKTQRKAIVYGAIWTDKGLIYVAKINDKGELELLCD